MRKLNEMNIYLRLRRKELGVGVAALLRSVLDLGGADCGQGRSRSFRLGAGDPSAGGLGSVERHAGHCAEINQISLKRTFE